MQSSHNIGDSNCQNTCDLAAFANLFLLHVFQQDASCSVYFSLFSSLLHLHSNFEFSLYDHILQVACVLHCYWYTLFSWCRQQTAAMSKTPFSWCRMGSGHVRQALFHNTSVYIVYEYQITKGSIITFILVIALVSTTHPSLQLPSLQSLLIPHSSSPHSHTPITTHPSLQHPSLSSLLIPHSSSPHSNHYSSLTPASLTPITTHPSLQLLSLLSHTHMYPHNLYTHPSSRHSLSYCWHSFIFLLSTHKLFLIVVPSSFMSNIFFQELQEEDPQLWLTSFQGHQLHNVKYLCLGE